MANRLTKYERERNGRQNPHDDCENFKRMILRYVTEYLGDSEDYTKALGEKLELKFIKEGLHNGEMVEVNHSRKAIQPLCAIYVRNRQYDGARSTLRAEIKQAINRHTPVFAEIQRSSNLVAEILEDLDAMRDLYRAMMGD
jgi:hypothetical protein